MFDLDDPSGAGLSALWSMVCALDEAGSMGGALLSEGEVPLRLVTDSECVSGVFRYRFDARGDDGARYVTVTLAKAEEGEAGLDVARAAGVDLGDGVLWCDFAEVVDAGSMVAKDDPGVVGEALAFFSSIDYRPFWVSLKTSGLALAISFALGLFAAWRVMGTSSRLKGVLDSVFTIPMVLPPTVCGFLLLMLFGQSTAVGRWLIAHGITIVFTWEAAVIHFGYRSRPAVWRWPSPLRWGCSPHGASWARRVVSRASSIRCSPFPWCCPPRFAASCCSCCSGNPRPWAAGS